jgi:NAD(P)-dependent dehydrogenase (short-subunit alcohol dehydrogenase family)
MAIRGPAVVTGASRGLGRAIALELARRGFDVVATMRQPADGASLVSEARELTGSLRLAALDVERPESIQIPPGLQVLVNNAGTETAYLPAEHAPLAAWREVFETNVFGLAEVTRQAIPELRRNGSGVVCNVTSASLLFPMPFYAVYRASKAAVQAFGESLRAELQPFGVRVLEVMPGPIATDMLAGSDREPEAAADPAYRALAAWAWQGRRASEAAKTPATEAARRIAEAILDLESPLRIACDPLGESLIAAADGASFEERLRGALATMPGALPSEDGG